MLNESTRSILESQLKKNWRKIRLIGEVMTMLDSQHDNLKNIRDKISIERDEKITRHQIITRSSRKCIKR
jgi:hypothetical protein